MLLHTFLILLKNAFLPTRGGTFHHIYFLVVELLLRSQGNALPCGQKKERFGESPVRTFRNGSGGFTGKKTYVVVKWTSNGLFPLAWQ